MFSKRDNLEIYQNLDFSVEKGYHQVKILEILRNNLPKFSEDFVNVPVISLNQNTNFENYISQELSFFLNNQENGYIFGFQAIGPDILVRQFGAGVHGPTLFLIEAKRLPPTKRRDYVLTGIRRFKMEEHGKQHDIAAMLGYVQDKNFNHWYDNINLWIEDLIADAAQKPRWEQQDKLNKVGVASYGEYTSTHSRVKMGPITLHHFWLNFCNN